MTGVDGEVEAAFYAECGRRIVAQRKRRKVSASELAAEVGVHRNTISRWESGDQAIPFWMLLRIADILECNHLFLTPGRDYTWGKYYAYLRERDPKRGAQSERDPPIDGMRED